MIDIHRVVGRLGELVKDAHPATALGGCAENSKTELLFAHGLRARECEENAAGGYFVESLGVKPAVTLQGVAEHAAVLGKGRRVEYYEVVDAFLHCVEVFEGIFGA